MTDKNQDRKDPGSDREAGATLISVLMSAALLGAGVVVVSSMLSKTAQLRKAVELRADATLLKKTLLNSTDCRSLGPCQGNQLQTLKDFDGDVLVEAQGQTKFGGWTVQAQCQPDKTLEVRVALLSPQGIPIKDPLKDRIIDWQAPESLLIEKGLLCGTLNQSAGSNLEVQLGPMCSPAQGSCPSMPETAGDNHASPIMCCEDGRDAPKPKCTAPRQELAAYWDRQNDWGMSGQWVVLCQ